MTITDEKLSAYIDGELAPDEIEVVSRALETDKALATRLETLKRPNQLIAEAYSTIDDEPMPDTVIDMLQPSAGHENTVGENGNVVQFPFRQLAKALHQWATPLAASIALAIGVGIGMQLVSNNNAPDSEQVLMAGVIAPTSPIHQALESTRSGESVLAGTASITPILTFKSVDGDFCREFAVTSGATGNRVVACRKNDQWETQFAAVAPSQPANPDTYSTASAEADARFDSFVDSLMANEALNTEEERALLGAW